MVQYAEPANVGTLILVAPVPCHPSQKGATSELSIMCSSSELPTASSYVVGPIDPAQLVPVRVRLSTGETSAFFIPPSLPLAILTHPVFQEGWEWGYSETDPEEEASSVPKLLNEVFAMLDELRCVEEADFGPWTVGFVLGELARIAECDRTLALTGLAHFCFILSFLPAGNWGYPFLRLMWAYNPHNQAVKAYRARVRIYREQGKSFDEAQRLALAENGQ